MPREKKEIPKSLYNSFYFKQSKEEYGVYTEHLKLKGFDHYAESYENNPNKKGANKLVGRYYRVTIGSPEQIALFELLQLTKHDERKD